MRRIVSVWFPHLAIERLRRAVPGGVPAERPFALIEGGARGQRISAVDARADRAGIRCGMSLADARAILPGLATRLAEPSQDEALLKRLAGWAGRYGPSRNCDGRDGLWIDVSGVAHLFAVSPRSPGGGSEAGAAEAALLADLVGRLRAAGLTARVGLADSYGAAHGLARFASAADDGSGRDRVIAAPGATRVALAALPVEALRLAPEAVLLLRRLGLGRIGDLYPLPRAGLERRFRDKALAAGVVMRLDQSLGLIAEPRRSLAEPPVLAVRRSYAEPLRVAAAVEAQVRRLTTDLARRLDAAGVGARHIALSLYRTDASMTAIAVGTSRACRGAGHLEALIAARLADVDAGFGIDALVLEARLVEPLAATQGGLGAGPDEDGLGRLVDRLSNRLGAARVLRLRTCDSHLPELASAVAPALACGAMPVPAQAGAASAAPVTRLGLPPPLLLRPPEPIGVMAEIPEGAPLRFSWRRRLHRVVKSEGPQRIAPQWWRGLAAAPAATLADAARDYYRLEDDAGGRYWVFRAGLYPSDLDEEAVPEAGAAPTWYMHGLFP